MGLSWPRVFIPFPTSAHHPSTVSRPCSRHSWLVYINIQDLVCPILVGLSWPRVGKVRTGPWDPFTLCRLWITTTKRLLNLPCHLPRSKNGRSCWLFAVLMSASMINDGHPLPETFGKLAASLRATCWQLVSRHWMNNTQSGAQLGRSSLWVEAWGVGVGGANPVGNSTQNLVFLAPTSSELMSLSALFLPLIV